MSKHLIKLLPLTAALAVSGLAHANTKVRHDQVVTQSVVVKYGDLNLNTTAGIQSLHARLRSAAKYVCSPHEGRVFAEKPGYDSCVSDSVKRSIADVGNENLSRYHIGRRGELLASN